MAQVINPTAHTHVIPADGVGPFILHNAFMVGTDHLQGELATGEAYVYAWNEGDTVTLCVRDHTQVEAIALQTSL